MGNLKKIFKPNDNDTIWPNSWNIAKAVLRGKYIALNACIEKNSKINKLSTNFTHNLSENRAGRDTGQLILRGQHNADAKICSRY